MAAQVFGGPVTITTSALNLTTSLSLSPRIFYNHLVVRADSSNAGTVWFGKSGVTAIANQVGFLEPGDAVAVDLVGAFINTDEIYFVGTSNDKIYVLGVG